MSLRTDAFDFELPERLIATRPPERRGESRMMVVDRSDGSIHHLRFEDFPGFCGAQGDLVVLNDTRVVPARFRIDGGKAEILCVERDTELLWQCMVRPGKRFKPGHRFAIGEATGLVEEVLPNGHRRIRFDRPVDQNRYGELALPPYMRRAEEAGDRERYQTVYAREAGAIAAPTAGLHFTPEILQQLDHAFVTLHVGPGTFLPVKAERVDEHEMHAERFVIDPGTLQRIETARRVVATGTTVVRVLEHVGSREPRLAGPGETRIFIYPPFDFRITGALLTNFHLPQSTLLMLVSAFASRELILEAYGKAVEESYRFYSYGDCMLIL